MIRFTTGSAPIALSAAFAATLFAAPSAAWAQSTGSQEIDNEEIVVTGTRNTDGVEGIVVPDVPKARAVLTQELIQKQVPGQSILNTINLIPGVNYTNTDPYGSSGGSLRIRGFDGNRISLTFDGIPLNDTGNYAIFGNQQLDPEIIEQVSVNLGATDVDSPTASAAGGTVNYRTRVPGDDVGAMLQPSFGEYDFRRVFGMIDTGVFTSFGTKAFGAASYARNDKFKGPGEIYKQQYNFRVYQPIGSGDDFMSIAGNYNQNRNNFYRNPNIFDVRTLLPGRVPTSFAAVNSDTPINLRDFNDLEQRALYNFDNVDTCVRPLGGAGRQVDNACGSYFNIRINPSNTGNIRGNSRFSLFDNLTLTVDPSYQYVLANGGGIRAFDENASQFRGANQAAGVDLNGDGDVADQIQLYTPNNTNTNRFGLTTSLIYDLTPEHRFRVAYTYDRGRHRQTGEYGRLDAQGNPDNPFGGRNGAPVLAADGTVLQQRDRLSIALLNQFAGEYRGRFLDNRATIQIGLRAPFFKRKLDQRCFTEARGSGFAFCSTQPVSTLRIIGANEAVPATGATPYFAPFKQTYKFDKLLPNVGASFRLVGDLTAFGSYAKGFSAPRTDNLYRAPRVNVDPETTDSFDLGVRYNNRQWQAQVTGWAIDYKNRIVSSFDPELGISIDRNIGSVKSRGVDVGIGFKPVPQLLLYGFGSYLDSEVQDNVPNTIVNGVQTFFPTAGKFVVETPKYSGGGRVQVDLGPFSAGMQGKYVGKRFATDVNDVVTDSYTTFDFDARISLAPVGLEDSFFQLNAYNLFGEKYIGNIGTSINVAGNPNFGVGAPRAITGTLRFGF